MHRRNALAIVTAVLSVSVAACGASPEDQQSKRKDAEDRGFGATAVNTDLGNGDIFVSVSFGDDGCTGKLTYGADKVWLTIRIPVAGTTDETEPFDVDDPRVDELRTTPPLSDLCFKDKQQ